MSRIETYARALVACTCAGAIIYLAARVVRSLDTIANALTILASPPGV